MHVKVIDTSKAHIIETKLPYFIFLILATLGTYYKTGSINKRLGIQEQEGIVYISLRGTHTGRKWKYINKD